MYSLLKPSHHIRPPSKPRLILVFFTILAIFLVATGLHYLIWGARFSYRTFPFVSIPDDACNDSPNTLTAGSSPIPNLVHYVWLLKDPTELRLGFKFFISLYSAHLYWRPERIYIHTDATAEVIQRAKESGTPWTKRILAIPGVELNHVEAPTTTKNGVEIKWLPHKADFLRLAALREHGGVYLDTDAIPLRDVADLRRSGFRSVMGQQLGLAVWATNYLNNGVMMAVPGSNLITIFHHASHQFFDGGWDTASIRLLTDLGNRLASIPGEVLILQPQAFSPISWQDEDQRRLFEPTLDPATAASLDGHQREQDLRDAAAAANETGNDSSSSTVGACRDVLAWMKHREMTGRSGAGRDKGEIDFSSSYVLHAFDSALETVLGKGRGIDVKYVLERRSNYARAVFPAVWHAVQEGIIPKEEIS